MGLRGIEPGRIGIGAVNRVKEMSYSLNRVLVGIFENGAVISTVDGEDGHVQPVVFPGRNCDAGGISVGVFDDVSVIVAQARVSDVSPS